jgi:CubicO group peptidase (beta-lactamase class C family)
MMDYNFSAAEKVINANFPAIPAAQLCVRQHNEVVYSRAFGFLHPVSTTRPTSQTTRFDMASVTKLFTLTAFMRLAEAGRVGLNDPVCTVIPEFSGLRPVAPYEAPLDEGGFVDVSLGYNGQVDAGQVTFKHLLTHTSGLPAWRPLYLLANEAAAAQSIVLNSFFSYNTGAQVVYSDLGLILVGMALERLTGKRLDAVIAELVTQPLGLEHTGFIPTGSPVDPEADIAPTEICRWRKHRLFAEVDDENCGRLGGIAGHAGVFSTAREVALLGQSYLTPGQLLKAERVAEMTRQQTAAGQTPRGIGFSLWSNDPEASYFPFSQRAFGHTGFTGTCVWVDPTRDLVVAFLTNEVYHGRQNRVIMPARVEVHQAVVAAIDQG